MDNQGFKSDILERVTKEKEEGTKRLQDKLNELQQKTQPDIYFKKGENLLRLWVIINHIENPNIFLLTVRTIIYQMSRYWFWILVSIFICLAKQNPIYILIGFITPWLVQDFCNRMLNNRIFKRINNSKRVKSTLISQNLIFISE